MSYSKARYQQEKPPQNTEDFYVLLPPGMTREDFWREIAELTHAVLLSDNPPPLPPHAEEMMVDLLRRHPGLRGILKQAHETLLAHLKDVS